MISTTPNGSASPSPGASPGLSPERAAGAPDSSPDTAADGGLVTAPLPEAPDTSAALLVAGRKLFARYGYEGASVRAITSEAGANLGAITYHFGSKRTLYNRVVESCVTPLATRVEAALASPGSVLDRLELVIHAYFDHFGENPDLPQLMLQEIVLGGGPPEAAGPTMRRLYGMIQAVIEEGQAAGQIRQGEPVLLGLSLISQPIFPMLVREPVRMLTSLDMRDPATRERVAAHVATVVRAALEKRPEEGR